MKKLILFSLLFCFYLSGAQDKIKCEMAYLPNHQYTIESKSVATVLMEAQVDEAMKKQLAAAGMSFPIKMEMTQDVLITQKTGALNAQKEMPLTMEYVKVGSKQTMAGKEIPAAANPLNGAKVTGYVDSKNQLRLENFGEGQLDDQMKAMISKMMDQMQTSIQFPAEPLKVGDQFEQSLPMEIPVQGGAVMKMTSKTIYKLKSIESNLANFDLIQTITLDMSMNQGALSADGSGTGTMIFDAKKKFMAAYKSDIDMEMLIKAAGMDMNMKTNTVTEIKVSHP